MMQYASLLSISMALISSVRSQDSSDLNTQIASTILQFQGAQIVPNVIPTANLTGALTVAFGDTQATIGQLFDGVDALQTSPTYNVQFRDSPEDDARYTVAFVDPSFVGSDQNGVTRHMLANDLTLSSGSLTNSTPYITEYNAPYPAEGDPAHRYLQLVYLQPSGFTAPSDLNTPGTPLANNWDLNSYVSSANLDLVAASYIQVVRGTVTGTASETQSVESASVAALASSLAGSSASSTGTPGTGSSASKTSAPGAPGASTTSNDSSSASTLISSSIALVLAGSVFAALA